MEKGKAKKTDWLSIAGIALLIGAAGYAAWTFWPRPAMDAPEPSAGGNTTPIPQPGDSVTLPDGSVAEIVPYEANPPARMPSVIDPQIMEV